MALHTLAADALLVSAGKDPRPFTSAVIVAAGSSVRMNSKTSKQFLLLGDKPVLAHTLLAFERSPFISEIIVVARHEDLSAVWAMRETYGIKKPFSAVSGGATRALSVRHGFAKIDPKARFVAIHDGARCLITPQMIEKVCRAAYRHRAATAATAVFDTVKRIDRHGRIKETINRDELCLVQTPQIFDTNLYRAALATAKNAEGLTDDNQLIEALPFPIRTVDCGEENLKITTPRDLAMAQMILALRKEQL